jgi:hypothetical protein
MKHLIYFTTFIASVFVTSTKVKAQVNAISVTNERLVSDDSSYVSKIAAEMKLNKSKTAELMAATRFNSDAIKSLTRNRSIGPTEKFESIKLLEFERKERVLSILDSNQREVFIHRMQMLSAQRLMDREKLVNEDASEIEKHLPKTYYNDNTPKQNEEVADKK